MRGHKMRFQYTAISMACITLLTACGGSGSGEAGNKEQMLDFPYPKPRQVMGAPEPLVATAASKQAVTFTSETPSVCTVADGNLVPVKAGECLITASVPGDSTYAPATARQLFMVLKQPQLIAFMSPGPQDITKVPAPLVGMTDSGLPLTYASSTPAVCTVSGVTLTYLSKGQCQITASQPGDESYAAATPVSIEFKVDDEIPPMLTVMTGFASATQTLEGGEVGFSSGSNLDGWWCTDPKWCSKSFSETTFNSSFTGRYTLYTKDPAHPNNDGWTGGYARVEVMVPGVTISSTENTTTGLQVGKQTTLKFHLTQNAEWFLASSNKVKIWLKLGHYIKKADGGACNVMLESIVQPPTRSGVIELQLGSFTTIKESCGATGLNAAAELLAHPIVQVQIESDGINLTNASTPDPDPSFVTELTLTGPMTIQ